MGEIRLGEISPDCTELGVQGSRVQKRPLGIDARSGCSWQREPAEPRNMKKLERSSLKRLKEFPAKFLENA